MPLGMQSTKRRIKSVNATKKITKAMQLVATAKLKKTKDRFVGIQEYSDEVMKIVKSILAKAEHVESKFFLTPVSDATLYVVYTASLGLCGGYNSNALKEFISSFKKEVDQVIMVGSKGISFIKHRSIEPHTSYIEHSVGDEQQLTGEITKEIISLFTMGKVKAIKLIYTRFVNSVSFQPVQLDLLPVSKSLITESDVKIDSSEILFEPDPSSILDSIIPLYLQSVLYGKLVESHVSEQASRRMAMENATDNAEEINEKLLLDYNKARQSAITQEISEVVAGANAL